MTRDSAIRALTFLTLLPVYSGCGSSELAETAKRPLAVLYTRPTTEEIAEYAEFVGQTEACDSVDVRARVTGFLKTAYIDDGADVKKGDLLFEIDDRLYLAELERAEASLSRIKARLQRTAADLSRIEALAGSGAITQEQHDLASGGYSEAMAQTRVAESERRIAQLNFDYCRVRAPLSGRAGRAIVDEGSLVKQDETVLISIVATDPIEIEIDIDERTLLRMCRMLEVGEAEPLQNKRIPLQVRLADEDSSWHDGTIDFVDNRLDPTTGTIRVQGTVSNPDGLFSPGMFVRARLQIAPAKTTILIAERALCHSDDEQFVYVLGTDDRAHYRPVTVGPMLEGRRVIEEGLSGSDRVLVSGLQRIRPNMKVAAKREPKQKRS